MPTSALRSATACGWDRQQRQVSQPPPRPRVLRPLTRPPWAGLPPQGPGGSFDYEILRGYIKLHPRARTCGVLDALDDIRAAHPDAALPSDVQSVRVRTYAAASAFDTPARNELEALQYPTAVALSLLQAASTMTSSRTRRWPASRCASWPKGSPSSTHGPRRRIPGRTPDHRRGPASRRPALRATSTRPRGDADGDASRGAVQAKRSTPRAPSGSRRAAPHSPGRVARPAHPASRPLQAGRASKVQPAHGPGRGRSHMPDISMTAAQEAARRFVLDEAGSPSSPPSTHAGTP